MKKKVIGEFLYQFYRKRTSSFLAGIYKSTITGEPEDIHRLRVDVKKIYALYSLFELMKPEEFKRQVKYRLFVDLFKLSGRIREIQVHLIFLSKPKYKKTDFSSFVNFLKEQESQATRDFLLAIKNFNVKALKSVEKEIKKICLNIPVNKVIRKSKEFTRKRATKIQSLLAEDPGTDNVHKIRKHLKAMSTISSLVSTINPEDKLALIITGLNKTETMIGEWHDKIVLSEAIDLYLKNREETLEESLIPLNNLRQSLMDENQSLLKRLLPEAKKVAELILAEETGLENSEIAK